MNLEAERIQLIDISLEDDFLIDSHLDNSSLDLRLSVAYDTQNELLCNLERAKLRASSGTNNAERFLGGKQHDVFRLQSENKECRKSLAWDHAFFTSPGFLELEELSLVNRGFKTSESTSLHETQGNIRSKVCQERNPPIHITGTVAGATHRTQSLMGQKMTSPAKKMSVRDSGQKHVITRRSAATSGVVSKSRAVESITDRRQSLKATRKTGQTGVSAMHNRKPPLRAVTKIGEKAAAERLCTTMSRRPDSESVSSVSSSQSIVSSIATDTVIDLSPYTSFTSDTQTATLWRSQEMKGESFLESLSPTSADSRNTRDIEASPQKSPCKGLVHDINVLQALNLDGHRNNQQFHRSPIEQGSFQKSPLRQDAPKATRRPPLFPDSHQSPKPSSLRWPSQKIGFFDMKSGVPAENDCSQPKNRLKDTKHTEVSQAPLNRKARSSHQDCTNSSANKGHKRNQHLMEKKMGGLKMDEKENMFHPDDTVIELEPKTSSPSPSKKLGANGSSTSSQCSSSSGKRILKSQRPIQQTTFSTAGARIPFSTRGSPLKRSAFF